MTSLSEDKDLILALERDLLRSPLRHDRSFLEIVLGDDFIEFGKSGRRFNKAVVIEALLDESGRPAASLEMGDIQTLRLAADVILLTYALKPVDNDAAAVSTLRSSIWTRRNKSWQLVFHQGTPAVEC